MARPKKESDAPKTPRTPRKKLTKEEMLEKVNADIESKENELAELKEKKKALESEIKVERLDALDKLIAGSGKTLDDIAKMLESE